MTRDLMMMTVIVVTVSEIFTLLIVFFFEQSTNRSLHLSVRRWRYPGLGNDRQRQETHHTAPKENSHFDQRRRSHLQDVSDGDGANESDSAADGDRYGHGSGDCLDHGDDGH